MTSGSVHLLRAWEPFFNRAKEVAYLQQALHKTPENITVLLGGRKLSVVQCRAEYREVSAIEQSPCRGNRILEHALFVITLSVGHELIASLLHMSIKEWVSEILKRGVLITPKISLFSLDFR